MGSGKSKQDFVDDISDPESDSEYFQMPYKTDAAMRLTSDPLPRNVLNVDIVRNIEGKLEPDEIVSLTFLLYDRAEMALQSLMPFLAGAKHNILFEWSSSEQALANRWQDKFVEAVCIIQNYHVLRQLGFNKTNLISQFMPHRPELTVRVNQKRKALYLIAEKMDCDSTAQFLAYMRRALEQKVPEQHFREDYLELHFLFWEQNSIGIEYIKKGLKMLDIEGLLDMVRDESVPHVKVRPPELTQVKYPERTARDTTFHVPYDSSSFRSVGPSSVASMEAMDEDRYAIDPNNPGVVLIINQMHFYTELDPQYRHLLPPQNLGQLDARDGTMEDKNRLENTFKKFGFTVVNKQNLEHYNVVKFIKEEAMKITNESSFIVCILSHGDKDVIYGSNSCRVDVDKINSTMAKTNSKLIGRPKVLILQSCQGTQCQNKNGDSDDESMEFVKDGPSITPSKSADFLTIWATIPGYAAIRNVYHGSWLIQTLCDEVESNAAKFHLYDICTKAFYKISTKEWKESKRVNIMTPMVNSTLRKTFYLPPIKK